MISRDSLTKALADFLPRQRWYAGPGEVDGGGALAIQVLEHEQLRSGWPALEWTLVEVDDGRPERSVYQVVVGLRPSGDMAAFYEGKPDALMGEVETDDGPAMAYDALIDEELAIALLAHIAPEEDVQRARPLSLEQSNSSIVYDERLIMKLFRRLSEGPNPDAEVTRALAATGFDHVPAPRAEWRTDRFDLAVVCEFLAGSVDGFQLALTSLRDLYDLRIDPAEAGGDFAPDARRLGQVTAEMHAALAAAFGSRPAEVGSWVDDMETHLARVSHPDLPVAAVRDAYRRARAIGDAGAAVRIHGDYHLSQVLRTDAGWYVLDFEGEPARPLEERRRPSSVLRDVAGMLRSFHYASRIALLERGPDADADLDGLARAWEARNREAFLEGYLAVEAVAPLLPATDSDRAALRRAFEIDKAVYEVGYEQAHRPAWVDIPLSAVREMLEDHT